MSTRCPSPDFCRARGCQGLCASAATLRTASVLRPLAPLVRTFPADSCATAPRRRRKSVVIHFAKLP